jgi:hypothetical protein
LAALPVTPLADADFLQPPAEHGALPLNFPPSRAS